MAEFIDSNEQLSPDYKAPDANVTTRPGLGDVKLNNDLIPTIAIYAALETRGVVTLTGKHVAAELTNRREAEKGVVITISDDDRLSVSLEVDVEFGHNIYDTARRAQQHVKNAIEHMSGFVVERVDIRVRGIVPQRTPPTIAEDMSFPR